MSSSHCATRGDEEPAVTQLIYLGVRVEPAELGQVLGLAIVTGAGTALVAQAWAGGGSAGAQARAQARPKLSPAPEIWETF